MDLDFGLVAAVIGVFGPVVAHSTGEFKYGLGAALTAACVMLVGKQNQKDLVLATVGGLSVYFLKADERMFRAVVALGSWVVLWRIATERREARQLRQAADVAEHERLEVQRLLQESAGEKRRARWREWFKRVTLLSQAQVLQARRMNSSKQHRKEKAELQEELRLVRERSFEALRLQKELSEEAKICPTLEITGFSPEINGVYVEQRTLNNKPAYRHTVHDWLWIALVTDDEHAKGGTKDGDQKEVWCVLKEAKEGLDQLSNAILILDDDESQSPDLSSAKWIAQTTGGWTAVEGITCSFKHERIPPGFGVWAGKFAGGNGFAAFPVRSLSVLDALKAFVHVPDPDQLGRGNDVTAQGPWKQGKTDPLVEGKVLILQQAWRIVTAPALEPGTCDSRCTRLFVRCSWLVLQKDQRSRPCARRRIQSFVTLTSLRGRASKTISIE